VNTRDFALWKRLVSTSLSLALLFASLSTLSAQASAEVFQKLGRDNFDPLNDLRFDHETRNMTIRIFESNKDLVIVNLTFATSITNSTFASSNILLRVKFMPALTGDFKGRTGNIWLEAPKTPYQGAVKIPAVASSYVSEKSLPNDPRKDMSACGARTWMDDVPGRNMVSFEFSRNCFDLPNLFWGVSQIESDTFNSTLVKDVRFTPSEPFFIDMSSVPKPPKVIPKKDQTVSASIAQSQYFVDNTSIQVVASSSSGGALSYSSKTPEVCFVTPTGLIQPKSAGSCQVAVSAPGSETLNPAPAVTVTVNLIKKSQTLYFNPPDTAYLSQGSISLAISSEFNLPIQVVSTTPAVCSFPYPSDPTRVEFLRVGTCGFIVSQAGNFLYNPREGSASFFINADPKPAPTSKPTPTPKPKPKPTPKPKPAPTSKPTPKPKPSVVISGSATTGPGGGGGSEIVIVGPGEVSKITITCVKRGAKDIKITNTKPKCPRGYTRKK
jgi:hypothetical protein